ncbi:MAG: AAA family ATPase [Calditrichaceae bacterium]
MNNTIYHDPILSELDVTVNDEPEPRELFKILSANRFIEQAKKRPIPRTLFGEFWFENELCILFADTNLGKSILAVQIADSISRGQDISILKMDAEPQKVLYYDFELSDKQFENRYSENYSNHYIFSDNFLRAEMNPYADIPESFNDFESYLSHSLEQSIIENDVKIIIIDNITYLRNETEKARTALPLMKELHALKSKYGLSILALAHTPKRDLSKPLTRNDLQGSKMLINFCDSAFAIGESTRDTGMRYLKQIKARATEIIYHSENVLVCQIEKAENFIEFAFTGYGSEYEHLKQLSAEDSEKLNTDIIEMKRENPDYSNREIAKLLNTNHKRVGRALKRNNL